MSLIWLTGRGDLRDREVGRRGEFNRGVGEAERVRIGNRDLGVAVATGGHDAVTVHAGDVGVGGEVACAHAGAPFSGDSISLNNPRKFDANAVEPEYATATIAGR